MHKKWESMTPEQQQAMTKKAQEMWNKLTPEQQSTMMEHMMMMMGQQPAQ